MENVTGISCDGVVVWIIRCYDKEETEFFNFFFFFFQEGEETMKKKDVDENSFAGDGSQKDEVVVEYQKRGQSHTYILSFQNEE
jgi:hypothetical protein